MDHKQFEQWIFDMKSLSITEKQVLDEHIIACPRCQRLLNRWEAVEVQLIHAREVTPVAGFVERHKQYQLEKLAQAHKKQAMQSLAYMGIAILTIFIALSLWFFTKVSPGELIVNLVSLFSEVVRSMSTFRNDAFMLLQSTSPTIPYLVIVNLMGWASIASIIWALTVWRFARQGVSHHEK